MKPITFDVKYWPGVQGENPSRITLDDGGMMVVALKDLLRDPSVQSVQVTVEKTHSGEF